MAKVFHLWIGLLVAALLLLNTSCYVVQQHEQGLLMRLGDLRTGANGQPVVVGPGLHWKWPLVDNARLFDMRLQSFEETASRVLTGEQKYLLVDYYVKWRIQNLPVYYVRTGGRAHVTKRLIQQKINNALRSAFGQHVITDLVSGERLNIMTLLQNKANASARALGVDVVDVRIKRIDLPQEVSDSVYQRMRAKRKQVATKHRSDGKAMAEVIRANADAKATVTLANARAKAAKVRALGDRAAAQLYSQAFKADVKFYHFWRSLKAYEQAFRSDDLWVLQTDGPLFSAWRHAG